MKFIGLFSAKLLKKINSHIKYQLFLSYFLIVVILLAILGGVFYFLFSKTMTDRYYQYMVQLNNQIILNLEKNIYDIERASFIIDYEDTFYEVMQASVEKPESFDSSYFSSYKSINSYFINVFESRKEVYGIYVYSTNGENIYARNREYSNHKALKANNEKWFSEAIDKKGYKQLLGRHTNSFIDDTHQVISIIRAITDRDSNKILGVIVVDENVDQIGKIIDNIKIGEKGSVIIIDEKSRLVYSNDSRIYEKLLGQEVFRKNLDSNAELSYAVGSGNDKVVVIQSFSGYTNWKVITCIPYTDLIKDAKVFQKILAVILVSCLLFIFFISVFISGKASKSLIKMKNLMESVENGNLDVKLEVSGENEISKLGHGFNSMISKIKDLIEKEYNENLLRKEAELNLLQAQINPHFLYNTLGSIKSLAKAEGAEKAAEMIMCLSRIFRYNLSKIGSIVTIKDEIENIRNYLFLQQYRFRDKIRVTYDIEPETLDESIPIMTLQPIVENAIVHGLEPKQGPGTIGIKIRHAGEYTKIYISDDGTGMDVSKTDEINSIMEINNQFADNRYEGKIGIFNVNSRLKYRFGRQSGLKLCRNSDGGTTVEIVLPKARKEYLEG